MSGANMTPTTRKLAAKELPTKTAACVITPRDDTPRDEPPALCCIFAAFPKNVEKTIMKKIFFFLFYFGCVSRFGMRD
jgi:hypothetical protein